MVGGGLKNCGKIRHQNAGKLPVEADCAHPPVAVAHYRGFTRHAPPPRAPPPPQHPIQSIITTHRRKTITILMPLDSRVQYTISANHPTATVMGYV